MDFMTIIAWLMGIGMLTGALGGWSLFIVAWIIDRRSRGGLRMPRPALRLPRWSRGERRLAR